MPPQRALLFPFASDSPHVFALVAHQESVSGLPYDPVIFDVAEAQREFRSQVWHSKERVEIDLYSEADLRYDLQSGWIVLDSAREASMEGFRWKAFMAGVDGSTVACARFSHKPKLLCAGGMDVDVNHIGRRVTCNAKLFV